VRVVVNGVDPRRWASPPAGLDRADLGLSEGDVAVLVAGLLNPAKGQDLALEALARGPLAGRGDVKLLLAGHGDDLPALEAQVARLGLEQRVRFLGWRDDLPQLMAAVDLLLLPSRWEGMPYAVLEAMAAGLPVVATRVDGARDLVVDLDEPAGTGLVVDVGDAAAIAAGVGRLADLEPGERTEVGARGARRVAEHFTIEHMVRATRAVFREALEESA
jgi:glycosyltransferase involved in cell wall biosynthesis